MTTSFDSRHFRDVLGHLPTGVTIVTAVADGVPVGLTIGSAVSVSLDPPLVAWLPARTSQTWQSIQAAGSFCINVLSAQQADLCWAFAATEGATDRFENVTWNPAEHTGSPVIDGALAWVDCDVDAVHTAGDHDIVVGHVLGLAAAETTGERAPDPMVFYRGQVGTFDAPNS